MSGEKEIKIDTTKMNVFQKLQNVRVELSKMNLKRSATNSFSKFQYFELSDFIGQVNELCLKYGLFTYEDITTEYGRITAVNTDNTDDVFTLTIPLAEVEVKSMPLIQARGALLTYARRYLYMLMFEIAESDTLDAVIGNEDKTAKKTTKKTTEPKKDDNKTILKNLATELSKNGKKEEVTKILMDIGGAKNPNSITDEDKINKVIEELQKLES